MNNMNRKDNLISVNELRATINNEESPTIIDVRSPDEYHRGHLPGAINIPGDQISGSMDDIPDDEPIVTYCNMRHPGQSRSESAADQLRSAGYNARALQDGYPGWEQAGYPIDYEEHTSEEDPTTRKDQDQRI